jgi:hypothetical protein
MSAALKKDHYDAQHDNDAQRELRFLFKTAWELLANEPHPTIPGRGADTITGASFG